jgi:hypothetical protein
MLNAINLNAAIAAFRAATAAIPVAADEDVMDAAVAAESAAFTRLCLTPAFDNAGVAAKLAVAAELMSDEHPMMGTRIAESALEDMRNIRWQAVREEKIAA